MTHSSTSNPLLEDVIHNYLAAGWPMVTALPKGAKYPPVPGTTGHVNFEGRQIALSGYEWSETDNLGLVLATDDNEEFDIIALDVDQYDDKHGADNLAELEDELGTLNLHNVVRSTRRGIDSRSAQYFFKVPKGYEYNGYACDNVEIVQAHHRFSAVYPSIVDDMQYRWYLGQNEAEIPNVEDLPWLPEAWLKHLIKGNAKEADPKADPRSYNDAMAWLENRVLDGEPEPLEVAWEKGSRHDTMRDKVHALVQGAVFEGKPGLMPAIKELREEFEKVKPEAPSNEFADAVVGSVAKAEGAISEGDPVVNWKEYAEELGDLEALAIPNFNELLSLNAELRKNEDEAATTDEEPEPTAHGLIDLSAILNGTYEPLQPTVGQLSDGTAWLYPGEIHDIHGYSGSGKSWVGLALAAQEIKAGNGVLWVDYEQSPAIVVGRLRDLGLTVEEISERFGYMRPESFPFAGTAAEKEYRAVLEANPFSLVVLDGVNQSFSLAGYDTHSTDDANAWHRLVPLKAAKYGAAVVQIDHTVKNKEGDVTHAYGAQAKRSNVAVSIGAVATQQALKPGYQGKLELVIYKDRHGQLRARSQPYKNGDHIATFVMEKDNSFRFDPVNELAYSPFAVETKPGVLDGHADLPADDPRHTAKIGTLNGAIATVLCKRNRVETLSPSEMKKGWQELAPVRWSEDKSTIKKNLTRSRHTGLANVSSRSDRLKLRPLAEGDSGTSSEALAVVKTLADLALNSEG